MMRYGERRNVIQFVGRLSDGGAETLIKDYALLLDKEKFVVKVLVIRPDSQTAVSRILQENHVEIIAIYPHYHVLTRVFNRLFGRIYIPYRLSRILKKEQVDILHVHMSLLHHVAKIADKLDNLQIFYTCHNLPERFFSGRKEVEYKAARELIEKHHMRLIALHEDMRRELNDLFIVDNTVVIRNAVDFSKFTGVKESKEEIRKELMIPKEAFVIGHVGRFDPAKNQKFLVEIFRELHLRKENVYLLMVGSGSLRADVEELLREYNLEGRYQILSHRSDIPRLMKAMDVFVLPSKYEGLPLVLVEAQVSDLRCIISDSITREVYLTDYVIPVSLNESPEKWCEVILDEKIQGKACGQLADYDMSIEIKRLEKLYLGEFHD
ncbi:MAG: glycosyltransferase [Butyrivibrio sp.]|nr:glycosyltransferase [Muribaculum sp.]MCM1551796.1 glycosyltransferase [Butyrivibrio sp.]